MYRMELEKCCIDTKTSGCYIAESGFASFSAKGQGYICLLSETNFSNKLSLSGTSSANRLEVKK